MGNNCSANCECKDGGVAAAQITRREGVRGVGRRPTRRRRPYDLTGNIIAHEQGALDNDQTLRLFSELVRTGTAWTLQGHYGRNAARLIEAGYIERGTGKILRTFDEDV